MDKETALIVGTAAFCFVMVLAMLFASGVYESHLKHTEKMECMKTRGEYIGKTCIFRNEKPT